MLLLDTNSGDLLQQMRPHRRYCVSVAWSPDGRHFASAAWDDTVGIHLCTGSSTGDNQAPSQLHVEQCGRGEEASESPEPQMQTLASIPYTQHVNSVVFLPGGRQIAAAVKESVYLRLIDMDTMKVTLTVMHSPDAVKLLHCGRCPRVPGHCFLAGVPVCKRFALCLFRQACLSTQEIMQFTAKLPTQHSRASAGP